MTVSMTAPMTIDELIEEFEFLGDWDDRCDFLIDLGFELPKFPEAAKTEANRVHGCQSNAWMISELNQATDPPVVEIQACSDAMIVNGLIAVLLAIFHEKSPAEILQIDAAAVFRRLELDRHLSSQRKNGLAGMVARIREFATYAQAALDASRSGDESSDQ